MAIEDEIRESYINYAMSVIVSRALPDVRDGLKPVHRRILFSMSEMGLTSDKAFKKCGRIVGDVLGKYHPHGDQSIYDALVRLAQPFSMRYPVVNGQGNFGSVDGDPPAAMRYTEARLQKVTNYMLNDIKKDTVDYGPNYDDSIEEPLVLPAAFPYLLANGASGIAVGMATNIPPHNLREIGDAINAVIDNPDISFDELMNHIKGPDFPTGGIIFGRKGIKQAFKTGRGRITVRARCSLETLKNGRERILVTELPYQVNKANLIVRIADLVKNKKIDGIADLRDESDRNGMRIVIELKKHTTPKIILNQLYSHTQLQVRYGIINLALENGKPIQFSVKGMIESFIQHRREVIIRRTKFELKKAEDREHILEGLKIALENIDEIIELIKSSDNVTTAKLRLIERFQLSDKQSQAILDMRLQKLTSLETQKIIDELEEIRALIKELKELLASEEKLLGVIKEETSEIVEKFGDERRTEIVVEEAEEINIEDLIQEENMVVLITNKGYIKRVPVTAYRSQNRGGKGSSSASLREEDFVENIFVASTHEYVLFITNAGKAYWMKVHEIPEGSRISKGQHIKAVLNISANEEITAVMSLREFNDETFIFMATANGTVKKAKTSDFVNAKTRGIIAIKLTSGDRLISAHITSGNDEIIMLSRNGYALRYHEDQVRVMGRSSRGVRGIMLSKSDELTGVQCIEHDKTLMIVTENGYGKRINFDNFHPHGRGTKGQIAYKVQEKSGEVIGCLSVYENDDVMCITSQGNTIKIGAANVPIMGKAAFGVCIVTIEKPDSLIGIANCSNEEEE
ncbi:MAG: DNA topoisomerase (ATP-hydrolyzing) subunit A [Spirochaetia bacterium]